MAELSSGISDEWAKSSASGGGDCVEVRLTRSGVEVRDSKDPTGPVLSFTEAEWSAFLTGVALGEFRLGNSATHCAV